MNGDMHHLARYILTGNFTARPFASLYLTLTTIKKCNFTMSIILQVPLLYWKFKSCVHFCLVLILLLKTNLILIVIVSVDVIYCLIHNVFIQLRLTNNFGFVTLAKPLQQLLVFYSTISGILYLLKFLCCIYFIQQTVSHVGKIPMLHYTIPCVYLIE